jgi:hypothetical protein
MCPAEASRSWAVEVVVLAELARYAEARALADRIDREGDDAAKRAAAQARSTASERDQVFEDTNEAKTEMRGLFGQATVAQDAKEHARAKELFEQAWSKWHPNGPALFGAGLSAKALGDAAAAQRLFDRAMAELENAQAAANEKAKAAGRDEKDLVPAKVTVEVSNGFDYVDAVAWAPDGKVLAVADSTEVALVDSLTGRDRYRLLGHTLGVTSVALTPDGRMLASGAGDNTVRLWDVKTGDSLRTLQGHTNSLDAVAFAPDGRTLASGSGDKTVRLWDVKTGDSLRTLRGHTDSVTSVAFAPDGRTLASGSLDRTLRLWDIVDGHMLATLGSLADRPAGYVFVASPPAVDLVGDEPAAARDLVICRIGPRSYPFDLCAERFTVPGLLGRVLAGDATWADP